MAEIWAGGRREGKITRFVLWAQLQLSLGKRVGILTLDPRQTIATFSPHFPDAVFSIAGGTSLEVQLVEIHQRQQRGDSNAA
jgi:hypothetical protein